jgi:hypothetical protein
VIYGAAVVSALLAIMLAINVVGLLGAVRGTIRRNSVVGFRTRATQTSDAIVWLRMSGRLFCRSRSPAFAS